MEEAKQQNHFKMLFYKMENGWKIEKREAKEMWRKKFIYRMFDKYFPTLDYLFGLNELVSSFKNY